MQVGSVRENQAPHSVIYTEEHSCLSIVRKPFNHIKKCFEKYKNSTFGRRVKHTGSVSKNVIKVINAVGKIFKYVIDTTQKTAVATLNILKHNSHLIKTFQISRTFTIFRAPSTIYHFVTHTRDLIKKRHSKPNVIDNSIKIVRDTSNLLEISATFAKGLEYAGEISTGAAVWATPVLGISAALSLAVIASKAAWLYRTGKLEGKISKLQKEGLYNNAIQMVSDLNSLKLKKIFKVSDGGKLKKRIKQLHERAFLIPKEFKSLTKVLRLRIHRTKWSRRFSIVVSIVNIIGVALLSVFPLNPAAYVFLASAGLLSLAKFIYERISSKQFKTQLHNIENKAADILIRFQITT